MLLKDRQSQKLQLKEKPILIPSLKKTYLTKVITILELMNRFYIIFLIALFCRSFWNRTISTFFMEHVIIQKKDAQDMI